MAELDHLVFACRDLAEGTRIIEDLTGAQSVEGGAHVGRGTRNRLLTFDDRTYFEIIGVDPDQPDPGRPRGFGLDDLDEPMLVAFAVHPTGDETLAELAQAVRRAGFDPGSSVAMSRQKPDGELLEWELTTGGDAAHVRGGAIPFAIDWLGRPSPAASLPSMGSLVNLTVQNPDARVADVLVALGLGESVTYFDGPAQLTATVDTPNGMVTLR